VSASDVVVVGGGVVGCAVAYALAREGIAVTLLERDALASQASGAAAGMLAPLAEAEADGSFLTLGLRSLALFPDLVAELAERGVASDPEYVRCGVLRVATSDAEALDLRARVRAFAGRGLEWLDARGARAEAPLLADRVRGAVWSPHEAHVRSPALVHALAEGAQHLGARVETGVAATGLQRDGSRVVGVRTAREDFAAGHVVLCAGAFTPACWAWLDAPPPLPIEPVRGQILALAPRSDALQRIVWGEGAYLVPKRDGTVVVGATEERVGYDVRVTAEGVHALLAAALRLAPGLGASGFRGAWAGLRPVTPDRLPAVGPVPAAAGLWVAAGHGRNGILLAPLTGRLVADGILGRSVLEEARRLDPARFARHAA